jgi:hypothetical protein
MFLKFFNINIYQKKPARKTENLYGSPMQAPGDIRTYRKILELPQGVSGLFRLAGESACPT